MKDNLTKLNQKPDDTKAITSGEYHSLFKSIVPQTIDKEKMEIIPTHFKYRLFIGTFWEQENGLHEMYQQLLKAGPNDKLEIRIMSGGGLVSEGIEFFNIMENIFRGRVTTYLDSHAYSMGALMFSAGNKRIVNVNSDLMYHDYSGGAIGKGGEIDKQIQHKTKHIRNVFRRYIMTQKFLTEQEYKNFVIGEDFWMDAKEMCERGIATHVTYEGKEITAKKYLKKINKPAVGKSKKEKTKPKEKSKQED